MFVCLSLDERPRDSLDLLLTLSSLNVVYSHPSTPRTSLLGQGLITLPPAPWYPRRRLLTPAFHYDRLKDYAQLIAHSVYQLLVMCTPRVDSTLYFILFTICVPHTLHLSFWIIICTNPFTFYSVPPILRLV